MPPAFDPFWCTDCECYIPVSALTHGGYHAVEQVAPQKPKQIMITWTKSDSWMEVPAVDVLPDSEQWKYQFTPPGTYVYAVDQISKKVLAQIKVQQARHRDGEDAEQMIVLAVSQALATHYSKEC